MTTLRRKIHGFTFAWPLSLRWAGMLLISISFFLVLAYRIDASPDIFMDEIIYYRAAFNLATDGNLTWDRNPIFVHPPIQFLTQAFFLDLVGMDQTFYPFMGTYVVRLVNVIAAAITAALLFLLIERLSDLRTATIAALLLLLDPFVVRINRRNMLETMAEMWVLAALYLYWRNRDQLSMRKIVWIGFFFGCAILTKELVFFQFVTIPIFVVLSGRWKDFKKIGLIAAIALLIWLLFPFWAWSLGQWSEFVANKAYNFDRLRGTVQITGWNREGVSFMGALSVNIYQYGTSYLLILLGAAMTPLLLLIGRTEQDRFVLSWNIAVFAFFGYTIAFGTINDQFFYFLMIPVILITAFVFMRWAKLLSGSTKTVPDQGTGIQLLHLLESGFIPRRLIDCIKWLDRYLDIVARWLGNAGQWLTQSPVLAHGLLIATFTFGLAVQSYNCYRWVKLYALESDNSLFQLSQFVTATVPPGTKINSMFDTGEPTLDLMLPEYKVVSLRQFNEIQSEKVEYAVLSSKNLWGRYGKITPEYYEWIQDNGQLVFTTYGNSFWEVSLYKLDLGNREKGFTAHVTGSPTP